MTARTLGHREFDDENTEIAAEAKRQDVPLAAAAFREAIKPAVSFDTPVHREVGDMMGVSLPAWAG
jgi:hypothetical protein